MLNEARNMKNLKTLQKNIDWMQAKFGQLKIIIESVSE
jgi:hypothetical protein